MQLCEDIYLSATSNFTVYLIWKWNHDSDTDTVVLGAEDTLLRLVPQQQAQAEGGQQGLACQPQSFTSDIRKGQLRPESKSSLFSFRSPIDDWGMSPYRRMDKTP